MFWLHLDYKCHVNVVLKIWTDNFIKWNKYHVFEGHETKKTLARSFEMFLIEVNNNVSNESQHVKYSLIGRIVVVNFGLLLRVGLLLFVARMRTVRNGIKTVLGRYGRYKLVDVRARFRIAAVYDQHNGFFAEASYFRLLVVDVVENFQIRFDRLFIMQPRFGLLTFQQPTQTYQTLHKFKNQPLTHSSA